MTRPVVALVHLGRAGGMGGLRRVAGLIEVFEMAGAEVVEIKLRIDHRAGLRAITPNRLGHLLRGGIVPEALSWSAASARARLDELGPALVVCETSRAYDPAFVSPRWPLVLDFVDRLSVSYRDRADMSGPALKRVMFATLARPAARFERRRLPHGVTKAAAGWADAEALGATWVPITFPVEDTLGPGDPHDLLFFGNLSYPPNVEAIERMGAVWPEVRRRRPGTTFVVAGAKPTDGVRALADRHGWVLDADFADIRTVLASSRLVLAPLVHASGIQNKVLEAASYGRPQVIETIAASGLQPGFPARLTTGDDDLVSAIVDLLDDPEALAVLGTEARDEIGRVYTSERWVPWAKQQLATTP